MEKFNKWFFKNYMEVATLNLPKTALVGYKLEYLNETNPDYLFPIDDNFRAYVEKLDMVLHTAGK